MTTFNCFGECLIELIPTQNNTMQQSVAGDVFNTAVYLKRWFPDITTSLLTALGSDPFSDLITSTLKQEQINTDLILTIPDKLPGLYSIQTDKTGERNFSYWRSESAARDTMEKITHDEVSALKRANMFFFSAISLAILKSNDRALFWQLIGKLKQAGVKIAFDSNYRPSLWDSNKQAQLQFELALGASDIVLPSFDDFKLLFGHTSIEDVYQYCLPHKIPELVIKNGAQGVTVIAAGKRQFFEVAEITNIVDTTSAGDSFNGAYLGARLSNLSIPASVELASRTAGEVIKHPGAIVTTSKFDQFKTTLQLGAASE